MKKPENWLGCIKIYDAKTHEIHPGASGAQEKKIQHYIDRIGHKPQYNIWYDTKNPKFFGADDTYLNSKVPNEASFLDSKRGFLSNKKYGLESLSRYSDFLSVKNQINVHDDGFYEANPLLERYKGSTILIAGGGPSTEYCDWQKEERDYTWSCNHFYKNVKLLDSKVDLFYVNAETHMGIPTLREYVKENNTICAIDTSISRPQGLVESFIDHKCETTIFNMRLFLTSGAAPKMVAFAALLGAKEIKIVGMDGWTKDQIETLTAGPHAFEKNKKLKISSNYTFDFQRRETVVFWDYYLNFQEGDIKFVNLGESYKDNMSSEISKKMFPAGV